MTARTDQVDRAGRVDDGRIPPLVAPGPELTREQVSRYSRHLLVPGMGIEAQRRLLNARVAVVGAGGLGSPILSYLAAAGVGHLTVIDDDVIDTTNLQRQVIHRTDGVGRRKVDSAAEHVAGLNPDVSVEVPLDVQPAAATPSDRVL